MDISNVLKKIMKAQNINTLELSRRTGVGQSVIHRLIANQTDNPKIATLSTLAAYFNITVNQLIGEVPLGDVSQIVIDEGEVEKYNNVVHIGSVKISDKHFSIAKTSEFREIAEPLGKLQIHYFNYIKVLKDGSQINFSNRPDFIKHFFKHGLHDVGNYEAHAPEYCAGYAFWNSIVPENISKHAREFGLRDGMTITIPKEDGCEFYCFDSVLKGGEAVTLYLNTLDLLQKFILYFQDKAADLIVVGAKDRSKRIITSNRRLMTADKLVNFVYNKITNYTGLREEFLHVLGKYYENRIASCLSNDNVTPVCKIVSHDFHKASDKIFFNIKNSAEGKVMQLTAEQVLSDKVLINNMSQSDVLLIGYVAAAERTHQDINQLFESKK